MSKQQLFPQDLVEITQIFVDPSLTMEQQKLEFARQLKDPNHFLCHGITVHAKYNPDGPTLAQCLQGMMG